MSPGVGSYTLQRVIGNGPSYHIAGKYATKRVTSPGPSDYKINPVRFLRRNSRASIGNAKGREGSIEEREKSPGPSCYNPNRIDWKKRAIGVRFNREKRNGIIKNDNTTPGPGDYMIPCKFLVRPRFME